MSAFAEDLDADQLGQPAPRQSQASVNVAPDAPATPANAAADWVHVPRLQDIPNDDQWEKIPNADSGALSVYGREAGQAAVTGTGTAMQGLGVAGTMPGVPRTALDLALFGPLGMPLAPLADRFLFGQPGTPAQETPVYQAGKTVKQFGEGTFPVTEEERKAHPIASFLGSATGSVGPVVAAGMVDPVAGLVLGASEFGLSGAGETYDAAKAKGADEKTAREAASLSGGLNAALGIIPVGDVFKPFMKYLPEATPWAMRKLAQVAENGITFASVGEAQNFLGQEIAKLYDPQAQYSFDVNRLLGELLFGGAMGAIHPTPKRSTAGMQQQRPEQSAEDLASMIGPAPTGERPPWTAVGEPETVVGLQPSSRPAADDYVADAMSNLSKTSRTASGIVDVTSTPGKADAMVDVSGEEAASRAKANYEGVIRNLYNGMDQLPTDGPNMASLIDGVAASVNQGIVKPDRLMRTADTKYPNQTAAVDLPVAHQQFSEELAARLADPNADPVETAAWIEWRANLMDHFWSDGIGKTSKALSAIPLMRAGLPLPRYPSMREFTAYAPEERVDPNQGGEAYLGPAWDRFNQFYHGLVEPSFAQQRAHLKDMIARGASVDDLVAHPLVQRARELNRQAIASGRPEDFENPEWRAARRYDFGGVPVQGWDAAVEGLTDHAMAFSTAAPVEDGHHAIIVLGPPASGKSTASEPLAREFRAALVDPDEAKKVIPEYRNGLGTSAVHEESSLLTKDVLKNIFRRGSNLVLPKVGHDYRSIKGIVDMLKSRGYRVDIVHVAASPEIAGRRNINRFLETGRLVDPEYIREVGSKPRDTAYMLKGDVHDFADIDTSQGQPEIVEGSGPIADALRARRNVGWSRPPGSEGVGGGGAGGPPQGLIGPAPAGLPPHRVTAADGTAVDVAPVVVEAGSLRTSQDYGYDPTLQPRNRDRAAGQAQVRNIAANLDPERLGYSSEADRGAPIVGPDGMVESGNGRVLALRRVYDQNGPAAQAYREWLARQGVNVDAYQNPVLVRQRLTPFTPDERRAFTVAANQAATLAMSAPERARSDANLLDVETLALIHNPDDLGAVSNRPFFRRFLSLLPQSEQGALADARGNLSAEGLARARNAILAKAYGDDGILSRIAESTNDEVKSISNALTAAAPQWARMRAEVEAGRVRPDIDVTKPLVEAVAKTADLRSRGGKLDTFLSQQDAFERLPEAVEGFMRIFYDPKGRRAASAQRITDAIRFYAQEAAKVSSEPDLGLGMVPVEARDILKLAAEKEWEDVGGEAIPERGGAGAGPSGEPGGAEARGLWLSAGREATPLAGYGGDQEARVSAQRPTLEEIALARGRGEQFVFPGTERISPAELASRRAAQPLRPRAPQQPIEEGLFGSLGQTQLPLKTGETVPTMGAVEAPNVGRQGPAIRAGAQAVPTGEPARRVAPAPARRPQQLSLFGGGAGEPAVRPPDVSARPQPGGAEAAVPRPGEGVTKPPAGGRRTNTPRPHSPTAAGRVEAQKKIAERSRSNYRITPEDQVGVGGPKQKVRANLDAIRVLRQIEDEARDATPAEKATLVKYVGWGAFAQDMFADRKTEWKAERDALRAMLNDEEFEAARASTLNAHFTSPDVVRGMWSALDHMGYDGGQAIEPGAGIGHFIGMIPDRVAPKTAWTAVELDPLSGRIMKALYGGADVNITGFEKLKRPSNYYDLAISNVPFGDYNLTEKPYGSFPIHDFFFVKSLDKVRPGGVVAFITSRYTMDRVNPSTRRLLAKTSDLVGAIRLPGGSKGAFAGNAGTQVTTDVLFLRKKVSGEPPFSGASWEGLKEIQTPEGPVQINEYFADRPQMMMGEMRLVGSMYRSNEPVLLGDAEGLQDRIVAAARTMPRVFLPRETPPPPPITGEEVSGVKDGAFFLKDGKLYQRREGQGHEHPLPPDDHDRVARLIGMRDTINDLLASQLQGSDAGREAMRRKLRDAYDNFVKAHGPINKEERTVTSRLTKAGEPVIIVRQPNLAQFKSDPDVWKVSAIEDYDSETGKSKPAAIQNRDVIDAPRERQINGPSDALAASLDDTGAVDLDHIAQSLNVNTLDDVIHRLGDLVYQNPDGRKWETADQYLSGNVVQKLEDARAIAQEDPSYLRNVSALEKVQPEPLVGADITAQFGAPWVPEDVYEDFLREIGVNNPKVVRVPVTGEWRASLSGASGDTQARFGTQRVDVSKIINAALNNQQITVRDRISDTETRVNDAATTEARVKTELLKEAFTGDPEHSIDSWAFGEPERAQRLEGIFNRTYNNLANRKFDGTHLTLPGLNPDFATRQHRKDAVWRMIQNGNTLLAHVVGSGKTATMIAGGMEQKRLGLINKPAYVIPNHMLEQFSREFIQAYPNAKILVAQKDEMTRENRKAFLAKVSANDWDGVILTHDAFGRINMGQEWRRRFIREQLDELDRVMKAEKAGSGKNSVTVKNLEKAKKKLQDRLTNLMNEERKDEGTSFEESGIDFLFVDEAHKFKNLAFISRLGRVKGLAQGDSQRAEDLFLKTRYLDEKRPGRSAVFATGTPVSNTMAELWTMQRYLQLDKLKERGLDTFDAWASTFGRVVNNMELSADGRTFKEVSSFSKFVNVPELISLYAEVADTKTADMLNLPRPEIRTRSGAPGIEIVEATPSSQEEEHIQKLVELAESLKGKRPEPGQPNMLSVVTQGRKVATDGRLISQDFDFNPQGKIAKAVDNISRIYHEGSKTPDAPNKVQMVFLDMGVPQTRAAAKPKVRSEDVEEGGGDPAALQARIDLYADLKKRLIEKGIPAREIAAIHDATDDTKKAKLFARVRKGDVRVILGSSEKMGVGTNVQDRLIAMHHLDAPWKPAEVEQRDGRIVRQGNLNPAVQIYRYVTKKSFDAFMWQKLDTKSRFIAQVLSGAKGSRHAEDIDNPLPEAAEMKAAASGDPRIMEHAELDREVRALTAQRRAFETTKSRASGELGAAQSRIKQYEAAMPNARDDANSVAETAGDRFVADFGGVPVTDRKEAGQTILRGILSLDPYNFRTPKVVNVGKLSGFDMNIELRMGWDGTGTVLRATPSLRGKSGYSSSNDAVINEHTDPAGLIRRFENILGNIRQNPQRLERELANERASVDRLQKTLTQTWPREDAYRTALKKLDDLTKAMKAPEHPDVTTEKAQRPMAPTFYSAVERAVTSAKQEKASPEQWLATIRNTPGVKAEELDWLQLPEWLSEQKGPVTKQQVADYIRANKIDVQEVTRGLGPEPKTEQIEAVLDWVRANHPSEVEGARQAIIDVKNGQARSLGEIEGLGVPDDLLEPLRQYAGGDAGGPKFGQYTLPGGESYRELLLTLPRPKADMSSQQSVHAGRELAARYGNPHWDDMATAEQQRWIDEAATQQGAFISSHWDEPNVLAHVRFDDRVIDGKKTLHVSEFQSDWHQRGRRQGYDGQWPQGSHIVDDTRPGGIPTFVIRGPTGEAITGGFGTRESAERYLREEPLRQTNTVPDAPFKTTWPELLLKRMVRYAAENGYQQLSWDSGATNADRYDLSKQVKQLSYNEENGHLIAVPKDGSSNVNHFDVKPEKLADYVGKDVATKLMEQKPVSKKYPYRILEGLDLKVGGEGMVGFYDRILPAAANKLGKKFGAKVGDASLDTKKPISMAGVTIPDEVRRALQSVDYLGFDSASRALPALRADIREGRDIREAWDLNQPQDAAAVKIIEKYLADTTATKHEAVHTLPITDSLRQAATQEGFPLFRRPPSGAAAEAPVGMTPLQIGPKTVAYLSEKYTDNEKKISAAVQRIGDRMAPQAKIIGAKALRMSGEQVWGAFVDSPAMPHLIAWSLEKPDEKSRPIDVISQTVRHEIIHHLRTANLIRPDEWEALAKAAKDQDWFRKYRIDERYPDASAEKKLEEAVAEHFANWRTDREALKTISDPIQRLVRGAYQRLDLFFRRVAAAAREFLGRNATASDVFSRIESGEVGRRTADLTEARGLEAAARTPAQQRKQISAFKHFWASTFQPELVSDHAFEADPIFAAYKSGRANARDLIFNFMHGDWRYWNKQSQADQLRFVDEIEHGITPKDPEQARMAGTYRKLLDHNYANEKQYGSKAGFVQDYFPHIWERAQDWAKLVAARTAQLGPTWFQKERTIDFIKDGLDAGLKLRYSNPVDMLQHRLLSGVDMRLRMELLQNLKKIGLAWEGAQGGDHLIRRGWLPINAPDRKQWVIAPDIQLLWKNAVEAKGLWQDAGVGGRVFRGWMALKNAWVPIKLTLTAFHPLHVLHIDQANSFALAWDKLRKGGDVAGAMKSAAEGAATIPTLGMVHYRRGAAGRQAWLTPPNQRTPEQKAAVDLMTEGGFRPQLAEEMKIGAKRQLDEAFGKIQRGEAGVSDWRRWATAALRHGVEAFQGPIFEKWIPALKSAAYLQQASALLQRRPELLQDKAKRQIALRTIAKSIDNRYGEMNYDTLFWNRYAKDAGIGSFLSLGWNLGFVREFGGAAGETAYHAIERMAGMKPSEAKAVARDASNKLPFAVGYIGSAMLLAGAMTYLFTGTEPEGNDFIFPRIGGTNPDGTPRRVSTMFYTREAPMLLKHVQERGGNWLTGSWDMLWNKLMFEPFAEVVNNRDYYGYDIWDENAPIYKQIWQGVSHFLGSQLSPMSVSGAAHAAQLSGKPFPGISEAIEHPEEVGSALGAKGVGLSMLGFGPAPAYVEKSNLQNRIAYLFQRYVLPVSAPEEQGENTEAKMGVRQAIVEARRTGDSAGLATAIKRGLDLGMSPTSLKRAGVLPSDVSMFARLPTQMQQAILAQASSAEWQRYWPKADKATKAATASQYREHLASNQQRARGGRVNPCNINHSPTEAQKAAGNYAKDTINIYGMTIKIENAKGSVRRGVGKDGRPWSVVMPCSYGYIKSL